MKISVVKIGVSVALIAGFGYGVHVIRGPHGLPGLMEKRERVRALEDENEKLHRENEEKRSRINRLENNPAEQELEIRQRLKLVRPGEKVYILQDQAKRPAH